MTAMRSLVILALTLVASGSGAEPAKEKAQRIALCAAALDLQNQLEVCGAGFDGERTTLESAYVAKTRADLDEATIRCAVLSLEFLDRGRAKQCELVDDPDARARRTAFLETWYRQRTVPRPTRNRARDQALRDLAARRDELCACTMKDQACLDLAELGLEAAYMEAPRPRKRLSSPYEDDLAALNAEGGRCRERLARGLYKLE